MTPTEQTLAEVEFLLSLHLLQRMNPPGQIVGVIHLMLRIDPSPTNAHSPWMKPATQITEIIHPLRIDQSATDAPSLWTNPVAQMVGVIMHLHPWLPTNAHSRETTSTLSILGIIRRLRRIDPSSVSGLSPRMNLGPDVIPSPSPSGQVPRDRPTMVA